MTDVARIPAEISPRGFDSAEVGLEVFAMRLASSPLDERERARIYAYAQTFGLASVISPPGYATAFLEPTCRHNECVLPEHQRVEYVPLEED